ncbi:MAG: DUF4013 domain-containing protein [Verrucomicrobiaceae bacterium]|nr:DUF4013 domain-containing protein [Verrucomicrobiaceae bacterium]
MASVLGSVALGTWLALWPLRLAVELWHDAELIAPGSRNAGLWHAVVLALAALTFLHVVWAIIRGGKLRWFLWPQPLKFFRLLSQEAKWSDMAGRFSQYIGRLRLTYLIGLGLKGFAGALVWLAVPVALMFAASSTVAGVGAVLTFVGGVLLALVAIHLPFLQARLALTGKFSAMWEWREVRIWFKHAPMAFWLALLVTLLLALPLYLLKIELTPRDLVWLPSLVFVVFIFPARILTGWAVSRARRRESPRHWATRWIARFATVPVAMAYGLVVSLTPYLSWNGARSLLEQHAFMVPAPLMAL